MRCSYLGQSIYIDFNWDQLAATVGYPLLALAGVAILGSLIVGVFKLDEDSTAKFLLPICGVFVVIAAISFLKWLISTWDAFFDWVKYC